MIRPSFHRRAKGKFHGRQGQTLVEYGLIITVIAVAAIGVLLQMKSSINSLYSTINSQVTRAGTGS